MSCNGNGPATTTAGLTLDELDEIALNSEILLTGHWLPPTHPAFQRRLAAIRRLRSKIL
jgi:hypothetical protein